MLEERLHSTVLQIATRFSTSKKRWAESKDLVELTKIGICGGGAKAELI